MGRASSTGLPFLVLRPNSGKFTYQRMLAPDRAPDIVGEITLPWCDRNRTISGQGTIKISLATGDETTARQRWTSVHAQVDALVQMAGLPLRARAARPHHHPTAGTAPWRDPAISRTTVIDGGWTA
jgi:hypothetical protein